MIFFWHLWLVCFWSLDWRLCENAHLGPNIQQSKICFHIKWCHNIVMCFFLQPWSKRLHVTTWLSGSSELFTQSLRSGHCHQASYLHHGFSIVFRPLSIMQCKKQWDVTWPMHLHHCCLLQLRCWQCYLQTDHCTHWHHQEISGVNSVKDNTSCKPLLSQSQRWFLALVVQYAWNFYMQAAPQSLQSCLMKNCHQTSYLTDGLFFQECVGIFHNAIMQCKKNSWDVTWPMHLEHCSWLEVHLLAPSGDITSQ